MFERAKRAGRLQKMLLWQETRRMRMSYCHARRLHVRSDRNQRRVRARSARGKSGGRSRGTTAMATERIEQNDAISVDAERGAVACRCARKRYSRSAQSATASCDAKRFPFVSKPILLLSLVRRPACIGRRQYVLKKNLLKSLCSRRVKTYLKKNIKKCLRKKVQAAEKATKLQQKLERKQQLVHQQSRQKRKVRRQIHRLRDVKTRAIYRQRREAKMIIRLHTEKHHDSSRIKRIL